MHRSVIFLATAFAVLAGGPVEAKFCDYRLSALIGGGGAAASLGGTTAVAASSTAMKAAGFYLITHSTSGAIMVGSTAAGASAAGTVGIIGGSAAAGGILAFVTAPVTVTIAALAAVGATVMEGGCFFADERITDIEKVLAVLQQVAVTSSTTDFEVWPRQGYRSFLPEHVKERAHIRVRNADGEMVTYRVSNLYIVNGELMHRDWGWNTSLGHITVAIEGQSAVSK